MYENVLPSLSKVVRIDLPREYLVNCLNVATPRVFIFSASRTGAVLDAEEKEKKD